MKNLFKNLPLVSLLFFLVLSAGNFAYDQFLIDSCSDQGGSFDYRAFVCDGEKTHPFVPYLNARFPRYIGIATAAVIYMGGAIALKRKKRKQGK